MRWSDSRNISTVKWLLYIYYRGIDCVASNKLTNSRTMWIGWRKTRIFIDPFNLHQLKWEEKVSSNSFKMVFHSMNGFNQSSYRSEVSCRRRNAKFSSQCEKKITESSDTEHLFTMINAWNSEGPNICLTITDQKKSHLFFQSQSTNRYYYLEKFIDF